MLRSSFVLFSAALVAASASACTIPASSDDCPDGQSYGFKPVPAGYLRQTTVTIGAGFARWNVDATDKDAVHVYFCAPGAALIDLDHPDAAIAYDTVTIGCESPTNVTSPATHAITKRAEADSTDDFALSTNEFTVSSGSRWQEAHDDTSTELKCWPDLRP